MHDDCIVAYNVNLEEGYIVIQTYNNDRDRISVIENIVRPPLAAYK